MNWRQLWNAGKQLITSGIQQIETKVKVWNKPALDRLSLNVRQRKINNRLIEAVQTYAQSP